MVVRLGLEVTVTGGTVYARCNTNAARCRSSASLNHLDLMPDSREPRASNGIDYS